MEVLLVLAVAGAVLVMPVAALVLAIRSLERSRSEARRLEIRIESLEGDVRRLRRAAEPHVEAAPPAPPTPAPPPRLEPVIAAAPPPPPRPAAPAPAPPATAPSVPAAPPFDLEQVIGARWATWIGVVAIVFAVGFLLRWTFQNNLIGPAGRVGLGVAAGLGLLGAGIATRNRRDIRFLSEGLAGGGLACLYLALFAAHQVYALLAPGTAFGLMCGVTACGIAVSLLTGRQATAMLSVIGGLLTPVLVTTEHPDERVLLVYLALLDLLVLGVARSKSWPWLNRVAWVGTAGLLLPVMLARGAPAHPGERIGLLAAVFLVFVAVPLVKAWSDAEAVPSLDVAFVVANAAAFFGAVWWTLERSADTWEAPFAVGLAAFYFAIALAHSRRVPSDDGTIVVHLAVAFTAFSLAFPLAFDGPWVTLAWAAEGAALLAAAASLERRGVAVWGGALLLLVAAIRAALLDPRWYPGLVPVWNPVFAVGLAGVALIVAAAWAASRLGKLPEVGGTGRELASILGVLAAGLLAALLWRDPPGLWPAALLIGEMLAVAALARAFEDRGLVLATLGLAIVAMLRMFAADHALADRAAEAALVNGPLLVRIAGCAALGVAARLLEGADAAAGMGGAATMLGGGAGVLLLLALSEGWVLRSWHEVEAARGTDAAGRAEWRLQVGLSVLWTVYAAAWLAVGFVRRAPWVRYAALALLGATIVKVFLADMANVGAVYRILSFLVLGVVLLAISYVYQRGKPGPTGTSPTPPAA